MMTENPVYTQYGIEELIVALHDIAEVASRPTLARLAKIGRIAEQVASMVPARNDADHPVGVA
jgi:hypothetical protein